MKIKNIGSNMTEVELIDGRLVLVSYSTPVAVLIPGKGAYKTEKKCSPTTSRHINKWASQHGISYTGERSQEYLDWLI